MTFDSPVDRFGGCGLVLEHHVDLGVVDVGGRRT
jgi:hypothetical protein